jgi:hypothetical protein
MTPPPDQSLTAKRPRSFPASKSVGVGPRKLSSCRGLLVKEENVGHLRFQTECCTNPMFLSLSDEMFAVACLFQRLRAGEGAGEYRVSCAATER